MTDFEYNEVSMFGFNPSYRIQGQVYYVTGSIVYTEDGSLTAITVVKCSKWPRRFLNKELLPLMLKLSLMKPNGPQVNTPGGTIDLLVMG